VRREAPALPRAAREDYGTRAGGPACIDRQLAMWIGNAPGLVQVKPSGGRKDARRKGHGVGMHRTVYHVQLISTPDQSAKNPRRNLGIVLTPRRGQRTIACAYVYAHAHAKAIFSVTV
jgi:hypothetical protein